MMAEFEYNNIEVIVYVEHKAITELTADRNREAHFVQVAAEELAESALLAPQIKNPIVDKYCDEKGIPIAPKSIKDMLKRVQHEIWDEAIEIED